MMLDDKEMNKSLSEKVGVSKDVLKKKKTGGSKGAAGSKKKKTKSPWDSDSASGKILVTVKLCFNKLGSSTFVHYNCDLKTLKTNMSISKRITILKNAKLQHVFAVMNL